MIKTLYKTYFTKSTPFLYPLTGLTKRAEFKPIKTFMTYEDKYSMFDYKLIAVYEKPKNETSWKNFLHNVVFKLKSFENIEEHKKHFVLIFNLSYFKEDYDNVYIGKYSQLSDKVKTIIKNYYGYDNRWFYIESYLYPEKFFTLYAKELGVDEEVLRKVGELCDPPDLKKEHLNIKEYEHDDSES